MSMYYKSKPTGFPPKFDRAPTCVLLSGAWSRFGPTTQGQDAGEVNSGSMGMAATKANCGIELNIVHAVIIEDARLRVSYVGKGNLVCGNK